MIQSQRHLQKEEFVSKRGESTINLGNYKNKDCKLEVYDQSKLMHSGSGAGNRLDQGQQGLSQTRFHQGFNRRMQGSIQNDFVQHPEVVAKREERRVVIGQMRSDFIQNNDKKCGFNIINGAANTSGPAIRPDRPQGTMLCGDGLGSEAAARGKCILRESGGRYFAPQGSGSGHQYRQEVLHKEGLLQEKYCGVLQATKKDLRSYGIEDQFSKSEYQPTNIITQTGTHL
ncbi:hypothetical protein B484DRAFT_234755 [Ochromonadaceae sp. CCMP2298]|nr:hypothetical protein B484DRAFT_234755 [Ochromonadaceae sp. CCMP2298]